MNDSQPSPKKDEKPVERVWEGGKRERFFGLDASKWVEIFLTVALVIVGIGQLCVYLRQASIMDTQANISKSQLAFQESVSRAWLKAKITLDLPIRFTEWAGDKFIDVSLKFELMNTCTVPAINTKILTQIVPFGGGDRSARL
jgi:hypothetical protein